MKTEYIAIAIMIIIAIALLYYGYTTFIKNKSLNHEAFQSTIDVQGLVDALGGTDNITDITFSPSKLTVVLKDTSLVKVSAIQALGASGIVEGKETLSMIFGRQSALIAEDIQKLM